MTPQIQARQRLINRFIFYSGIGIALSSLPDISMGLWASAGSTLLMLIPLFLINRLNNRGSIDLAGNLFVIVYNAIIFSFSNFIGYEGGVQTFYIFIIFIIPFLIDIRHRLLLILHLALLAIQIILLEVSNYHLIPSPLEFTIEQAAIMGRVNLYIVILLAPAVLIIIIQSQQEYARHREEYTLHLQEKNEALRQKNEELDRFAYSVSHDLRSPIASVLGLVELSKYEQDIDKLHQYNSLKESSLRKLEKFISDILDHSRNARMPVTAEEVVFPEMIREIFEQHRFSEAIQATLFLSFNDASTFYTDLYRLKIVLNNLISNAFRYARADMPLELRISVAITGTYAHITVTDNGTGIAPEHISRIFEMFYRGSSHSKGSGLGLYIVQECVKTIHGRIDVSSVFGEGTTFRIVLPDLNSLPPPPPEEID